MIGGALGTRNRLELQWFLRKLRNLHPYFPERVQDLRAVEDMIDAILQSNLDFDPSYVSQVIHSARELLNQFPSGHDEMKY